MINAALINYFVWLKDRGITLPSLMAGVQSEEPLELDPPAKKVIFCDLSGQPANQICNDLIDKMAGAIQLQPSEYLLCDLETAKQFPEVRCVVALASNQADQQRVGKWMKSKTGGDVIYIYHPLKMIANPKLKVETWNTLKQVMEKIQ